MGGLRGYGREMWRQIARRPRTLPEPRGLDPADATVLRR